jgi:hypothetical protein
VQRLKRLWVSWCDGLWLCVWFAIAASLAYTLPVAALTWMVKAVGGGILKGIVGFVSGSFVLIASPVILSKVFRELDYPGAQKRSQRARPAMSEDVTSVL